MPDPVVVQLARTVRFAVNDPAFAPADPTNTYAGFPTLRGLGRHYELTVHCVGPVDPATGYFLNIQEIDRAVRATLIPAIARACREAPAAEPAHVLARALPELDDALSSVAPGGARTSVVRTVTWALSPYHAIDMSPRTPTSAVVRQRFEFAAAHRLHVPTLSDERNRELFGKCNNPAGHGHNYVVEPAVEVVIAPGAGAATPAPFTLLDLERVTQDTIIRRFDHTNLNTDTTEFAPRPDGAPPLNPSVENIARVCFDLLAPAIERAAGAAARLRTITVWETEKTCATYPATTAAPFPLPA